MPSDDAQVTVQRWSGREVRALRHAKRMSLREFAAHLGVSDRMVSKWKAGGEQTHPRPVNQAALDTSLAQSPADVHSRFKILLASAGDVANAVRQPRPVHHPVDGKLMVSVDGGVFLQGTANEPSWLSTFYLDVYPTTNADYARFIAATGHAAPQHRVNGRYPSPIASHPVVFVTWADAVAYAT